MNGVVVYLATLHAAMLVAYSQSPDSSSQFGKPCSSSFQCWRTEPVLDDGSPFSLAAPERTKRLEISSKGRGARCRCADGTCRLFHFASGSFLPCEEF
ncbi:unnamed protein product [Nippostrongylus brasiliensis]|uniref:Evasin n=1 Tax=Nippostrongylus brasiliensis TaxID=27835 RepID=A0A0N4XY32_NIPBR|nr:hypothetical protein Q1695_013057 [Nippostrongylus brasiliensis]VDL71550.1 unnamed protein product [Nippostrongylus brasiliensis]